MGDKGIGLPDAFEALAANGVYEAGGDAGAEGFFWIVDQENLLSC